MLSFKAIVRPVVTALAVVIIGVFGLSEGSVAAAPSKGPDVAVAPAGKAPADMSDAEMDRLIAYLDSLPTHVKEMSPNDPRFQGALQKAQSNKAGPVAVAGVVGMASVNWAWCAFKIGQFAVEMGLPISKAVRAFRAAKAAFGSWSRVLRAIRSGHASDVLGPELARILDKFTGFSGVVNACT